VTHIKICAKRIRFSAGDVSRNGVVGGTTKNHNDDDDPRR
jgi:hypothetical protein